ncbi:hypothetical protein [Herbaspirillum huttiense]|uniref:hypothetical protein n=1 Tax=Herbaspirillum huttiense TaxID=863372 RepID=UPI0039AFFCFB
MGNQIDIETTKKTRKSRRDDQVDMIRSIHWFYFIAGALRVDTATAIRKIIESHKSGRNRFGEPDKNEKMALFRKGARMPNSTFIDLANLAAPGSRALINHVLWTVLRHQGSVAPHALAWIAQLGGRVRRLMLKTGGAVRTPATQLQLDSLVREQDLDALAALTILFRLDQEAENPPAMWACSISIFQLLLLLNVTFEKGKVGTLIYRVYVDRVLKYATDGRYCRQWDLYEFENICGATEMVVYAVSRRPGQQHHRHEYNIMHAVLGDLPGQPCEITPPRRPLLDIGPPTKEGTDLEQEFQEAKTDLSA